MQLLAAMFDEVLARRGEQVTIVGATSGDTGAAAVHAFAGKRADPHRHAASRGPRLAGAAPPDDHGPRAERAQHRAPRHVRRLPGPGEGDVRRRAVPPRAAALGGQLDQLGAGRGPVGLLCLGGAAAGRARPAGRLRRADRQFRQRLCRPGRRRDRACRSRGWSSPPTRTTSWPASSPPAATSAARSSPPRARPWTSRSPATSSACCSSWKAATASAPAPGCSPSPRPAASRWKARLPGLFAGGSADQARWPPPSPPRCAARASWSIRTPPSAWPSAARHRPPPGVPLVTLATAHPAKFPDAVEAATGVAPALPARYADLMTLPERCITIDNELAAVEAAVRDTFGAA